MDGDGVPRVARRIEAEQGASGQVDDEAVVSFDDAGARYGGDASVIAAHGFLAVHGGGTGDENRRVDHVPRATRMHGEHRVGQVSHEFTGTTGVVEMDVGEDHPVDIARFEVGRGQGVEESRQGMRRATVDERPAAPFHHEVGGVERGAAEAGVDGVDTVHGPRLIQGRGFVWGRRMEDRYVEARYEEALYLRGI